MRLSSLTVGGTFGVLATIANSNVDPGWSRLPIRSSLIAADGFIGGEGCQVVRSFVGSRVDPNIMLAGIDVGGLFRSVDAGQTWAPALVGWNSRGGTSFAFDPQNASHVIGVGGNSNPYDGANGIHVSFDTASSWNFTLPTSDAATCLDGQGAVFDPSSYRPDLGYCTRAYYSNSAGMWMSNDGGITWSLATPSYPLSCLAIDEEGRLYISYQDATANLAGLYACGSDFTGGAACPQVVAGNVTGIDIPAAMGEDPSTIYISNIKGVQKSSDYGKTWVTLGGAGLPNDGTTPVHMIAVSPADPAHMSAWYGIGAYYNVTKVVSHDGGSTWAPILYNNTLVFMPNNARDGKPIWDPFNASLYWDVGGDIILRSADAGSTLQWGGNGFNGVMLGSRFAFNMHYLDTVMLAFQDYAGAYTNDGGYSWTWANVQNTTWGGQTYGGFALTPTTMWTGASASGWTGNRTLTITFDGGDTWVPAAGSPQYGGMDASYGDPTNPDVGFASNWRTADAGHTWTPMVNCSGVLTHDFDPSVPANTTRTLFGVLYPPSGSSPLPDVVVASIDSGATWVQLFSPVQGSKMSIVDVAYDWQSKRIYAIGNFHLYQCSQSGHSRATTDHLHWPFDVAAAWTCSILDNALPHDQHNTTQSHTVAVDPVLPSVVYVGQRKDVYLHSAPVARSTDAGNTFVSITLDTPLGMRPDAPLQGPHELSWVRVHPATRRLWVGTGCFGMWTAPPPSES